MTLLYSFLFCGFICLLGQIILDNTKLTPGHLTSIFVVIGSVLGAFGIYDKIVKQVGMGATLPITSFGNTLVKNSYIGYLKEGLIGLFSGMLQGVSLGIVSAIVFSFIIMIFTKAYNEFLLEGHTDDE